MCRTNHPAFVIPRLDRGITSPAATGDPPAKPGAISYGRRWRAPNGAPPSLPSPTPLTESGGEGGKSGPAGAGVARGPDNGNGGISELADELSPPPPQILTMGWGRVGRGGRRQPFPSAGWNAALRHSDWPLPICDGPPVKPWDDCNFGRPRA